MVFSSLIFLFVFLPFTLLFYYVSQEKYRNFILLIASIIFYAYGEPKLVLLMLASIIVNYLLALCIEQRQNRKLYLVLSILYNLSVLFVFKYLGFAMSILNQIFHGNQKIIQLALPIGISFYTFQSMSYVIDVYTGKANAQRNILNLGLYVALFPQLIAGPIVRYNSIAMQIENRALEYKKVGEGAKRFMCGLCKKVILSNNLSLIATPFFSQSVRTNSVAGAWLGAISFSLQIYYDFSGYSDMAIGLGKMLGFEFEENFNYPYISKSVTEFWRRWHISLGRWFRDYVYIPLGGSRVSITRHILNLLVVWLLTGLWHGASFAFVIWGLLYFISLVIEKYIIKPETRKNQLFGILYRIFALLFINFEWVLFNASDLKAGIGYCLSMLGFYYHNSVYDVQFFYMIHEYGWFVLAAILFATPILPFASKKIMKTHCFFIEKILAPVMCVIGFLWSVSYLILGAHNPFIYFNF